MKFMQRNQDHKNIEHEDEDHHRRKVDDTHWVLDLPEVHAKQNLFVMEPSYVVCEDLKFGRLSFKGFNPHIEKLMQSFETEQELAQAEEREKQIAVSDEEMVERYDTLVGTIGKKFSKKKRHSQTDEEVKTKKKKRRGFLKPDEFLAPMDN
ncbi:M-phase phosphoprotein 6-like [Glandiceps talaboti]